MASPIVVTCPECAKQMKAPADAQGKRVRCTGCGHTFALKPPPAEDDHNPYGLVEEAHGPARCPHCAQQLSGEEAVVCLHCGYNLLTRQRLATKKVIAASDTEQLQWLLPGIGAVAFILVLIGIDIFYCLALPRLLKNGDYEFLGAKGIRVWVVIVSLAAMVFAGRFAFQRLILQPKPPEVEKDV